MNMIKVKGLKMKKNPKFPNHCPFSDTNLIHEGSGFLSTAFLGLFGCIPFRPHAVKLYFMPEGNLTHNVTGILMVREHLPSRWRHWRFTQCENAAQILLLQPDHLKSRCLAVLYGCALWQCFVWAEQGTTGHGQKCVANPPLVPTIGFFSHLLYRGSEN